MADDKYCSKYNNECYLGIRGDKVLSGNPTLRSTFGILKKGLGSQYSFNFEQCKCASWFAPSDLKDAKPPEVGEPCCEGTGHAGWDWPCTGILKPINEETHHTGSIGFWCDPT